MTVPQETSLKNQNLEPRTPKTRFPPLLLIMAADIDTGLWTKAADLSEGRVILRMEVSHAEHAHLFGEEGERLRKIKEETSCMIHVPEPNTHSNEVTIRGKLPNVIRGFQKIRSSVGFEFYYHVPSRSHFYIQDMDLEESICACEAVYSVEVVTEITKENLIRGVVVRGAQVPRTLLGVEAVCRLFSGCTEETIKISQQMAVHPHSQSSMLSLSGGDEWLKKIVAVTGAAIEFPCPKGANDDRETITIRGSINGVAAAYVLMMSMLPITLRVFIGPDVDYKVLDKFVSQVSKVNFLFPRRERRPEEKQYVELKTYEGNVANLVLGCRALIKDSSMKQPLPILTTGSKLNQLGLKFALAALSEGTVAASDISSTDGKSQPDYPAQSHNLTASTMPLPIAYPFMLPQPYCFLPNPFFPIMPGLVPFLPPALPFSPCLPPYSAELCQTATGLLSLSAYENRPAVDPNGSRLRAHSAQQFDKGSYAGTQLPKRYCGNTSPLSESSIFSQKRNGNDRNRSKNSEHQDGISSPFGLVESHSDTWIWKSDNSESAQEGHSWCSTWGLDNFDSSKFFPRSPKKSNWSLSSADDDWGVWNDAGSFPEDLTRKLSFDADFEIGTWEALDR